MNTGKNKMTKVLVIAILLILLLTGGLAYAVLKTDIFKSPKELFGKYLKGTVTSMENFNFEPYVTFNKKSETIPSQIIFINSLSKELKEELEEEYYSPDDDFSEQENEVILNYIKNGELVFDIKNDPTNKKVELCTQLKAKDDTFFLLENYFSQEQMAIRYSDLYDKYVGFKNENLKQIFINAGMDDEESLANVPDEIPFTDSMLVSENSEKIVAIEDQYIKEFVKNIPDTDFKKSKEDIAIGSNTIKSANVLAYSINGEKFFEDVLEKVKEFLNDPNLKAVLSDMDKKNLDAINENYSDFKESFKDILNDLDLLGDFSIKVAEKDGKTIKIFIVKNDNSFGPELSILDNKIILKFLLKNEDNISNINTIELTNDFKEKDGMLKLDISTVYSKSDIENEKEKIENKINSKDSDETVDFYASTGLKYKIDYLERMYKDKKYNFTIKTSVIDENNIDGTLSFKYDLGEDTDTDIGTNIEDIIDSVKFKLKLNKDMPFTNLSEENCDYINQYTKSDYMKLALNIAEYAKKTAKDKPYTLAAIIYQLLDLEDLGEELASDPSNGISLPAKEIDKENSLNTELNNKENDKDFDKVSNKVKNAIDFCLLKCQTELSKNPEADVSNYFSIDEINKYCREAEINVDFIDGENLKVLYKDKKYKATIKVDENYKLVDFVFVLDN